MVEKNEESFDDWIEKQLEAEEDYYRRLYEEHLINEAEGYSKKALEFISDTHKKTVENHYPEVNELFELWHKINGRIETLAFAYASGIETLFEMNQHVADITYSAINSAISGQYESANILLREWMEVYLFAIYFDSEIEKAKNNSKKLNMIKNECQNWLDGIGYTSLRGEKGPLRLLPHPKNDEIITLIARRFKLSWVKKNPYTILYNMYGELSFTVHKGIIRKKSPRRRDTFLPFDYEEDLFQNFHVIFKTMFEILSLILIVNKKELVNVDEEYWEKGFNFDQKIIKKIISSKKKNNKVRNVNATPKRK